MGRCHLRVPGWRNLEHQLLGTGVPIIAAYEVLEHLEDRKVRFAAGKTLGAAAVRDGGDASGPDVGEKFVDESRFAHPRLTRHAHELRMPRRRGRQRLLEERPLAP